MPQLGQVIKSEFPIFATYPSLVYLDSAASALKPAMVIDAMDKFYRNEYAPVHRGVYALAESATAKYELTRKLVAQFINANNTDEIIFTSNATESLNIIASSFCQLLKPGDEIVLTQLEHHANLVPWQQAVKRFDLSIRYLPLSTEGCLDEALFEHNINAGVKLVAVSAMSNVLGCKPNLEKIIKLAHAVGAVVVVDAAQSAAHEPIDVQKINCDFLAFTGHKLFGPTGVGVLYGRKDWLEKMPPVELGGHMIDEVNWEGATWALLPAKFEAGTPPITEVIGLGAAINFINEIGWANIVKYERELATYALNRLLQVKGLHLVGPKKTEERGALFSFTVDGIHPHDLAGMLDNYKIAVRAGHHCAQPLHNLLGVSATTRASFSIYNTNEDVDALINGIEKAKSVLAK